MLGSPWIRLTCLAVFINSAAAIRMNAIAGVVRRSEFFFLQMSYLERGLVYVKERTTAMTIWRERKSKSTNTYMSIMVNMNQKMGYKPWPFDNYYRRKLEFRIVGRLGIWRHRTFGMYRRPQRKLQCEEVVRKKKTLTEMTHKEGSELLSSLKFVLRLKSYP